MGRVLTTIDAGAQLVGKPSLRGRVRAAVEGVLDTALEMNASRGLIVAEPQLKLSVEGYELTYRLELDAGFATTVNVAAVHNGDQRRPMLGGPLGSAARNRRATRSTLQVSRRSLHARAALRPPSSCARHA